LGWKGISGIVVDLGVSSMQIDTPERGFSFQMDGPLDMRFRTDQGATAADLIDQSSEEDLANILWRYGDEQLARKIARAMVQDRPFRTTLELANMIARIYGARRGHIHPATRTFQALRIAVNKELDSLSEFLPQAVEALEPGGRLAVISFHSLEDRIVKQYFRLESRDCICPPEIPVCTCNHRASIVEVSRRPIEADEEEILRNPRSRSARLRVAEKLDLA
ncbi:MAG: 16S rRNA (cytosine(1402)-N(4))-methyltransferase RsmH, partial [Anaerolineaceae bacterium]|nr:16S rRNA (cytosine(1402)-N(4))-methyltransferase RsmH [Anaerolineaceae bacterium]